MTARHPRASRTAAGFRWIMLAGTCLTVMATIASSDARPAGIGASRLAVGTPDGQSIEESNANPFSQGAVRRLRVGVFPPNAVQGGWGLRVIRVLP